MKLYQANEFKLAGIQWCMEYGLHENKWASLAELLAVTHLSQQMVLSYYNSAAMARHTDPTGSSTKFGTPLQPLNFTSQQCQRNGMPGGL